MLGINKITVADEVDENGNDAYVVEVSYYLETEKDEFGLPALDLSRDTKLYAQFSRRSARVSRRTNMIIEQSLAYPTYLGTKLNPDIQTIPTGYKYPFYAKFNIDKDEDLSQYNLVLSLRQNNKSPRAQVVVELFSGGILISKMMIEYQSKIKELISMIIYSTFRYSLLDPLIIILPFQNYIPLTAKKIP